MTPVDQTILACPIRQDGHDENGVAGDCLRACIATTLDCDLLDVPHFADIDGEAPNGWGLWFLAWRAWMVARNGMDVAAIESLESILEWGGQEAVVAGGPSPRGPFGHVVVVDRNGDLLHDPHPSRLGLAGPPEHYYVWVDPYPEGWD